MADDERCERLRVVGYGVWVFQNAEVNQSVQVAPKLMMSGVGFNKCRE